MACLACVARPANPPNRGIAYGFPLTGQRPGLAGSEASAAKLCLIQTMLGSQSRTFVPFTPSARGVNRQEFQMRLPCPPKGRYLKGHCLHYKGIVCIFWIAPGNFVTLPAFVSGEPACLKAEDQAACTCTESP